MSSPSVTVPVIGAVDGTTVEIVPGRRFVPLANDAVRPVALAELVPAGDGTWRLVARICPQWFPVSSESLRRLGIGLSRSSLKRLIIAGFVEGQLTTPGVYQFDYFSFREHTRRAADPEFWGTVEKGQRLTNAQRYSSAVETSS